MKIPLTPRLDAVAGFVPEGASVADIGTDHAYMPIRLAASGKFGRIIACDVAEGPLENARRNIDRFGMTDRIELRLCDGLSGVREDEADTVTVAGMGGDLIARIIGQCEWLRRGDKTVIMQPMTSAEELRDFLAQSGFEITRERAVREGRRLYPVISARFCGGVIPVPDEYRYIGRLAVSGGVEEKQYISAQAERLRAVAEGMERAKSGTDGKRLRELADKISSVADSMK